MDRVAWSARILAASRDEETYQTYAEPRLVYDSFAAALAYGDDEMSKGAGDYAERRLNFHHAHFIYRQRLSTSSNSHMEFQQQKLQELEIDRRKRPDTLIRTKFIDELVKKHGEYFLQVVLLGAGMDTRAYRLPFLNNTSVFEVDSEEVIQYKSPRLEHFVPICKELHRITGDFNNPSCSSYPRKVRRNRKPDELSLNKKRDIRARKAIEKAVAKELSAPVPAGDFKPNWVTKLINSGYKPDTPTIWIAEGLFMYLLPTALQTTFKMIQEISSPNSVLCFDMFNSAARSSGAKWYSLFQTCIDRKVCEQMLRDSGWNVDMNSDMFVIGQKGVNYERYLAPQMYYHSSACNELHKNSETVYDERDTCKTCNCLEIEMYLVIANLV